AAIEAFGEWQPDEVLRLAASLDQLSPHVFAGPIVQASRERGLTLEFPTDVEEVPGAGIHGRVGSVRLALGKAAWLAGGDFVPPIAARARERAERDGTTAVFITVQGKFAGVVTLEDPLRSDAARVIRQLRTHGIKRIVVLSGDRTQIAESVGATVGADLVLAERSPEAKVEAVREESRKAPTAMIGDGINDAPALAAAQVGIAMGARGATAASEAADAVIVVDRLERVVDAIEIARHARSIAVQSVVAGMALSGAAMVVAAFGYLPPVAGAIFQEAIDVAVILNALRALGGDRRPRPTEPDLQASDRVRHEHAELRSVVAELRRLADAVGLMPAAQLRSELRKLHADLAEKLLPHEMAEGTSFYPIVARTLGGQDPTGVMLREHAEISSYVREIGHMAGVTGPLSEVQVTDLRRALYGLYAVMKLHMAQEDEEYLSLFEDAAPAPVATRK
ncbi:MAG TPA: heavy metal translocating P-type ATPase, partial [Candidatus Udaeobacter sp.]|nr:heavy metal translocating P-type ATPase [Candidatus Udaeobacter sp.]